jgi:dTDP-4-amino-4,6-dideoxygalactose transaminase
MTGRQYFSIITDNLFKRGRGGGNRLRASLAEMYSVTADQVFITSNGRNAEYLFLRSLKLHGRKKVAITGFTCNASVNPVLWSGFELVYIDIDKETLNMSLADLKRKWSDDIGVVIVQHTFANSEGVKDIVDFAKEKGVYVFEDCAHALGVQSGDYALGSLGDGALLSFGIEKMLPTRVGGALLVNNSALLEDITREYRNFTKMNTFVTIRWLLQPVLWLLLRRLGRYGMSIASTLARMGVLFMGFERGELTGEPPKNMSSKLSDVLADIALVELQSLDSIVQHRKMISNIYHDGLEGLKSVDVLPVTDVPFVRYPIMTVNEKSDALKSFLLQNNFYIGDWYNPNVYPDLTDMKSMMYEVGSCPNAEDVAGRILNLPTGLAFDKEYAEKLISSILKYYGG